MGSVCSIKHWFDSGRAKGVKRLEKARLSDTPSVKNGSPVFRGRVILPLYDDVVDLVRLRNPLLRIEPPTTQAVNFLKPIMDLLHGHLMQRTDFDEHSPNNKNCAATMPGA